MPSRRIPAILFFAAPLLLFARPGRAAQAIIGRPGGAAFAAQWAELVWDPARQGPLITVEPLPLQWIQDPRFDDRLHMRMPTPPQRGERGYEPAALADYYQWSSLRVGSLTAIGPREMVVLNVNLGEPDLFARLQSDEKARIIIGLLRPDQLRRLASPQGIGAADLTVQQRQVFAALLPNPVEIRHYRKSEHGGMSPEGPPITLSPDQRAAVRIKMELSPRLSYPSLSRVNGWATVNNGSILPVEALGLEQPRYRPGLDYGVDLTPHVPNKLKPSHLDFSSARLNPPVSLEASGDINQALTVVDIVRRAAEASGLELDADRRVAGRSVYAKGPSARAGDVLKALCFSITGTFRRVGPAYVLTDDTAGIGSRQEIQRDWMLDAGARISHLLFEADRTAKAADLGKNLEIPTGPGSPLSPERMRQLPVNAARFSRDGAEFATADLSPEWQQRVRAEAAAQNARQQQFPSGPEGPGRFDMRIRDDRVRLSLGVSMRFLVPGLGPVDADIRGGSSFGVSTGESSGPAGPNGSSAAEKPPAADMERFNGLRVRALYVSPADAAEARRAAEEADSRGFTDLWVGCAPDNIALVREAVAAGRARGIRVVAVVPLLYRDAGTEAARALIGSYGDRALDVNILGEFNLAFYKRRKSSPYIQSYSGAPGQMAREGEWLRGDGGAARQKLVDELGNIARIDGLSGMVLTRSAPPGYGDPGDGPHFSQNLGTLFGYGEDMRLGFLRKYGMDPIDMPPGDDTMIAQLPFFSDTPSANVIYGGGITGPQDRSHTVKGEWAGFRFECNRAFMAEMYRALKGGRPNLPLMLDDRSPMWMNTSFFVDWASPEVHRGYFAVTSRPGFVQQGAAEAQVTPRFLLRVAPDSPVYRGTPIIPGVPQADSSPGSYARQVSRTLEGDSTPAARTDGIVLDLSAVPLARALPELRGFPKKQ